MTRWIATAGAFVVSLDSMVNIAFPSMAAAFQVPPEQMRWVIICYVGTYAVMSFVGGALADRAGHGRVFSAGVALGAVGLALAGTAPTLSLHLGGRVVQGFAAGLVYGTAPGLVTLAVAAERRGRALGFLNAGIGLALAMGPLVAGLLVEAFGWRTVFHIRVPLALVVAVLAWALFTPSLAGVAVARRLVSLRHSVKAPLVHATLLSFMANAGIFAIWLLAPFYLVARRGLDARSGGAFFMLTPLGTTLAAPLGGRLADRMGARLPMAVGLGLEAAGLWRMSRADAATPPVMIALALFAAGLGLGVFQVPNMASVMAAFPREQQGAAGGLAFLARTLGVVAGVAVLARVFAARRSQAGFEAAFGEAFVVAAAAVATAALMALVPTGRSSRAEGTRPPP